MNKLGFKKKFNPICGLWIGILFLLITGLQAIAQDKPNILIIWADDMAPHVGAYGFDEIITPNLDAFAKEAVLFEEAHSNVNVCSASRTSILTGIRPSTSGIYNLDHDFKVEMPNNIGLPRHFKDNGYYTRSIGKVSDIRGGDWTSEWTRKDFATRYDARMDSTLLALEELPTLSDPWLLAIGWRDPHCPWIPPDSIKNLYDINNVSIWGPGRFWKKGYQQECWGPDGTSEDTDIEITDEQARDATLRYYGAITDVDRRFGIVMDKMKELGLYDNTIIIFWSGDHGFHLGQNGLWGKWNAYRADSWVPLIVKAPGRGIPGSRVPRPVETVDMYPTLVELAGLPMPQSDPPLEGFSFAKLLDVPTRPWKKATFTWSSSSTVPNDRGVKTEQYNYIEDKDGGNQRLYDMIADPLETTNLFDSKPDVVAEMQALMEAGWQAAEPDTNISVVDPNNYGESYQLKSMLNKIWISNDNFMQAGVNPHSEPLTLKISSVQGKTLHQTTWNPNQPLNFKVSKPETGIRFIQLEAPSGYFASRKLIFK